MKNRILTGLSFLLAALGFVLVGWRMDSSWVVIGSKVLGVLLILACPVYIFWNQIFSFYPATIKNEKFLTYWHIKGMDMAYAVPQHYHQYSFSLKVSIRYWRDDAIIKKVYLVLPMLEPIECDIPTPDIECDTLGNLSLAKIPKITFGTRISKMYSFTKRGEKELEIPSCGSLIFEIERHKYTKKVNIKLNNGVLK